MKSLRTERLLLPGVFTIIPPYILRESLISAVAILSLVYNLPTVFKRFESSDKQPLCLPIVPTPEWKEAKI